MKLSDEELGMQAEITRRDFIHTATLASLGLMFSSGCMAPEERVIESEADRIYPPLKTGMRGSHPGSFENAHALARSGMRFEATSTLNEEYDLIVVGAGISGLTAAYEYRKRFGKDARILLLDNHDDFGGHAKRNEFEVDGQTVLSWGGTMNLEYLSFSNTALKFLEELGIDLVEMNKQLDFHYGGDKPSIWFDEETFGKNVFVKGFSMYDRIREPLDAIDRFPISEEGKESLKSFYSSHINVLAGMSEEQIEDVLHRTSYTDFLSQYGGLTNDAVALFIKSMDGYWGVQTPSLSVSEGMHAWLPGSHLLGPHAERVAPWIESEQVAMFPDGNASIARLLVHALIPAVAENVTAQNVAAATFKYESPDLPDSNVRLRLNSTVVRAENEPDGVSVTYVHNGETVKVAANHCVLACYHAIIPYLFPELSQEQKEAQQYQVKCPMLLTNVLIRDTAHIEDLDVTGVYCPGRLHAKVLKIDGVNTAGYSYSPGRSKPVPLMFWGMMAPPTHDKPLHDQLRDAREELLAMSFEDFEREVRTVLHGILGRAGFDVQTDILAITVNRWPHGYSYGYMDLWDPEWRKGVAPHEIARQPVGNISIANSDAAASASIPAAIEEAIRAVSELT